MNKASKNSAKIRGIWALLLTLALLAAMGSGAMAQEQPATARAETVMAPLKYYSNGLVVSQALSAPLTPEAEEKHTVTYYLKEPAGGTWMHYYTEEREHGRLAKGPLYNPIDPAGNYERVFIGWYEDEDYNAGPVNLLRTPITADLSLYARFGDEAEVFEPEVFNVVITFTPSISGTADAPGLTGPEPEPVLGEVVAAINAGGDDPVESLVCTITAGIEGVPPDVRYTLQWQNNLSGELADIPGETGSSITFPATKENLSCVWRLAVVF